MALLLGFVGASALRNQVVSLDAERAAWGETVAAWLVTDDVGAGERIVGSVERTMLPKALVPTSSLAPPSEGDLPTAAIARVPLVAGEVLVRDRVAGAGDRLLDEDQVALTVTMSTTSSLVDVGDLVDVWAVDAAAGASRAVVRNARVLDRDDLDLTIAVDRAVAGPVALAALRPVTIALVG